MTKTLINWASTTVLVVVTLLALFIAFSSLVFGWQFNAVRSESMAPVLRVGGMVVTQPVDPETIEVGDIITYYSPALGKLIVHRVMEKQAGSQLYFRTQGDANSALDPYPVPAQNVVGKVSLHIPLLGYVFQFAKTPLGYGLLLALPGAMLIAMEMKNIRSRLSRLSRGRAVTGKVEALPVRRPWTTGLRREDWTS